LKILKKLPTPSLSFSNGDIFLYIDLDYKVKNPTELKEEFDLAVDCCGNAPAMEKAMSFLGHGGRLCVFGVANPKAKLSIEPFQVNLTLLRVIKF